MFKRVTTIETKNCDQKTIEEWLNTLVSPVREQALDQCDEEMLKTKVVTLRRALLYMCSWSDTRQGENYWHSIVNNLEDYTVKEEPEQQLTNKKNWLF